MKQGNFENEEFIRVGTTLYKLVNQPRLNGGYVKKRIVWNNETLRQDYGKDYLATVPKYDGFCTVPEHVSYQPVIGKFLNLYEPIPHQPQEGDFPSVRSLVEHIFGEQYELGMDYLQLLYLQPIQKMLSLPVAGLHFSEMVVDRVRERLLQLPGLRGFESVALFLDILNDLATAGPDEMHIIGTTDYKTQADGNERIKKILQFVENNYHNKITLEDIGAEVGMSPSSVCRYFKKNTCQNLWTYINGFRIVRAAQMIVETDAPISEISTRCGFHNISNFNHAFRERIGSAPGEYRRKFGSTVISPDRKQVEEIGRKLDDLRNGGSLSEGGGNPPSGTSSENGER